MIIPAVVLLGSVLSSFLAVPTYYLWAGLAHATSLGFTPYFASPAQIPLRRPEA